MVKYKGRTCSGSSDCYKRTGCLRVSTSKLSFCRNTVSTLLVLDRIEQITMSSSAQPIAAQPIAAQQIAAEVIQLTAYLEHKDKVVQANKAAENSELTLRSKVPGASELQKLKFVCEGDEFDSKFVIGLLNDDRFAIEGGGEDGSKCVLRPATGAPEQQWRMWSSTQGHTLCNTNSGLLMTARGDSIVSTKSTSSDTEFGLYLLNAE